ncbi:hypothetical protein EDB81DRAFT_500318 [Dactylonectria macrodidyma]|uniref:Uncharacterized protein n=1 Tax=Dactylonectria macrodidyma TaxID=307937 RepID=A0A9P9J5M1_9HYPO|nr:hypothetical protein EDB81DRAFT_500318 [Dactylonectria macrodidyma]
MAMDDARGLGWLTSVLGWSLGEFAVVAAVLAKGGGEFRLCSSRGVGCHCRRSRGMDGRCVERNGVYPSSVVESARF